MQSEQTGAAPSADTRGGQSARGGLIGRGTGGRFGSLVVLAAVVLGVWLVLRTALLAERWGEVDRGVWALVKVYAVGLVFDATTCLLFFVPALLVLGLLPAGALRRRPLRWFAMAIFALTVFLALFGAAAEWFFWKEFGARFNFIAVDYLVYTQELVGNAVASYPVVPILAALGAAAVGITLLARKALRRSYDAPSRAGRRLATAAACLAAAGGALLVVRPSWSQVSPNRYNGELAKNGPYGLVAAFFENTIDYAQFYPTRPEEAAFVRLRKLLADDRAPFVSGDVHDIARRVPADGPPARKNVILVVGESLSAEFLGTFGNKEGLTPRLDALAREGLLFTRFYATGTRTVRGLEAMMLSIPPTPGCSVIKRPHNAGMFTLATVLAGQGYRSTFLYGGRGFFDNMNVFFGGNGFALVDQTDMSRDEVTFATAWGVCDEDLFARVVREADRAGSAGAPFLFVVMTTSNHRPFAYPQKIDIPSGSGRSGAVRYADYALGRLVDQARGRAWFNDTIFAFTADHCASSAGRTEVPVAKYHIPLLLYAPAFLAPGRCEALCSQIDFAPTLLGLLKVPYTSRFFGSDVLRRPPGRALLGTYQQLGLYTDGALTLLRPHASPLAFEVGGGDMQRPAAPRAELLDDTIACYQCAAKLLEQRYHHVRSGR